MKISLSVRLFCTWPASFSIKFYRLIYTISSVLSTSHSFFLLSNTQLNAVTYAMHVALGLFWPRNCNAFVYKFLYRHAFCFLQCISKIAELNANCTSLTVTNPHVAARQLFFLTTECPCPSQRQSLGTCWTRSSSFQKVYYKHYLLQKQITLSFSGLGTVF